MAINKYEQKLKKTKQKNMHEIMINKMQATHKKHTHN